MFCGLTGTLRYSMAAILAALGTTRAIAQNHTAQYPHDPD